MPVGSHGRCDTAAVQRLLLVLTILAALAAPTASAAPRPALAVTDASPFTVRGARFHAGETVTVVAYAGGRHVKRVVAGSTGAFVARFRGVSADVCDGWVVLAAGDRGSRAALKLLPECPPTGEALFPIDPAPKKP
jgi:hypothetical protein